MTGVDAQGHAAVAAHPMAGVRTAMDDAVAHPDDFVTGARVVPSSDDADYSAR